METNTNNEANKWTAWVMGDDDLVEVDIRTLDADKLAALRVDAASAGDSDLVAAIDALA